MNWDKARYKKDVLFRGYGGKLTEYITQSRYAERHKLNLIARYGRIIGNPFVEIRPC